MSLLIRITDWFCCHFIPDWQQQGAGQSPLAGCSPYLCRDLGFTCTPQDKACGFSSKLNP